MKLQLGLNLGRGLGVGSLGAYYKGSKTPPASASTPDSVLNSIIGDIDGTFDIACANWANGASQMVVAKSHANPNDERGWRFRIDSIGTMGFAWSTDGLDSIGIATTNPLGFDPFSRHTGRITRNATTGDISFYADGQLIETLTGLQAGAMFDAKPPAGVEINSANNGANFNSDIKIYRAQVYDGIIGSGGTLAVDFDPRDQEGQTSWTGSLGEPWTVNAPAFIEAIQRRYVSTLNGVDGFFSLSTPFVATTDYSIKAKFNYINASDIRVTGATGSVNGRVRVTNGGGVDWRPESGSGTSVSVPSGTITVIGTNSVEVRRIGAVGFIFINGIQVFTGAVPIGALSVDAFGDQGNNFGTGQFFDVELTDLVTPINSLFFRLGNPVGVDVENSTINTRTVTYNNITERTIYTGGS